MFWAFLDTVSCLEVEKMLIAGEDKTAPPPAMGTTRVGETCFKPSLEYVNC
jgi:hypothetical protein